MPRTTPKVAIIGGGASSAILLANLAESCAVDVYDRTARFARGVAYSTTRLCHLLNVRASNMSALADDKDHFARWAAGHGYASTDFLPRKLYGDYLESLWRGKRILADVESCKAVPSGYEVAGKVYDYAVLASGNVRALSPVIKGNPQHYYSDPWAIPDSLKAVKSVALIGSGLTAVDAVLSLLDIGFAGRIIIFSRHGLLPMVHVNPQPWDLQGVQPGLSPAAVMKALRRNARNAAAQGVSWQAVLDSIRPLTNDIWQGWSARQKVSFQRHLYTLWGVHRHRMAPEIATRIQGADISFIHQRVGEISDQGIAGHDFDAIINCMGYRYNDAGRAYQVSHRIGPACFGELFETTAIPEIRAQASAIAKSILSA